MAILDSLSDFTLHKHKKELQRLLKTDTEATRIDMYERLLRDILIEIDRRKEAAKSIG